MIRKDVMQVHAGQDITNQPTYPYKATWCIVIFLWVKVRTMSTYQKLADAAQDPNAAQLQKELLTKELDSGPVGEFQQESQETSTSTAFPTQPMKTVVGTVPVPSQSYDVQGQLVDSNKDTPLDVNAMHGVSSDSVPQMPETGINVQIESENVIHESVSDNQGNTATQTFLGENAGPLPEKNV